MGSSPIASLKIQTALDRCVALIEQTKRFKTRTYSSPGSLGVLDFVDACARRTQDFLKDQAGIAEEGILAPEELELRIQRATKLVPVFHELLGLIDGSDIDQSPAQLVSPLRRYFQALLPNCDIVLSSKPELNYSITEIAQDIRKLLGDGPLRECCKNLPADHLFLVTLPASESEQVLLHAILSHEASHGIYEQHRLGDRIFGRIRIIKEDLVKAVVQKLSEHSSGPAGQDALPPLLEVVLRSDVTAQVNERISKWVRELCSDALGIRLFGPAFYFAFVHFFLSFVHLDRASRSHPPPRLRLKLLTKLCREVYAPEELHPKLSEFFGVFDIASQQPIVCRGPFEQIAVHCLNEEAVLGVICEETAKCLPLPHCYSHDQYRRDIDILVPLILNLIPPGETGVLGAAVGIASIFNVGWYVYLCKFGEFQGRLHQRDRDKLRAARKLQKLLLKALEISEIKIRWEEARHDSRCREAQATV